MKFGYIVPNLLSPIIERESLRRTAQLAEAVGFDSIWVSDHILMPKRIPDYAENTEALITLAYLAGITQRVALGTSVLVLPMRHPILTAKQVATLAQLADREIIIGVGVGWSEDEYRLLGADFKQRGALADEYIAIMRKLWSDPNARHEGRYRFADVQFSPRLDVIPPIWVGGNSPAAAMRAARLGDGYQPSLRNNPAEFKTLADIVRAHQADRRVILSISMRVDMAEGTDIIIKRLREYINVGLEYPVIRIQHETLDQLLRDIERFAREIITAFR